VKFLAEADLYSRKLTYTLAIAHALSSTGFLAASTVTSIIGADLSGRTEWAGVPSAVYLVGVATASLLLGYAMDLIGRRNALSIGYATGVCGAAIAVWAVLSRTFTGFLVGLALMGPASAAAGLSRFVAAEVHPPDERGRAIALVVVGGTAGTLIWPLLSVSAGEWLARLGISDMVWPFGFSLMLLTLACLVIVVFLRPDPRDVARALADAGPQGVARAESAVSLAAVFRRPGAIIAMTSMISAHAVMVMVMVITSLHMRNHNHSVTAISFTTSLHVFGMYAFSILSGRLTDAIGRAPVIMAGAAVLVMACLVAPLSPGFAPITSGLFLLGLGWNFCFVGGSSLLADQLSPDERARTQGFNDLLMGLVAASGSFVSGHVFAAVGYGAMGVLSATLSLTPLVLALWWHFNTPGRLRQSLSSP
jgi:MFS family permease